MQLPAKQTREEAQFHMCAICIGFPVGLRTDGRTDSDVITKTKISGIDRLLYFLTHGTSARGAPLQMSDLCACL